MTHRDVPAGPTWNFRTPARASHGTWSGCSPPPAMISPAAYESSAARRHSSSSPAVTPRAEPAVSTVSSRGIIRSRCQALVVVERVVDGPVEGPRHGAELVGEGEGGIDVDLDRGTEEAEYEALGAGLGELRARPLEPGEF